MLFLSPINKSIMMIRKFVLVLMAVIGVNALQAAENDLKPRLVVCTDIATAIVTALGATSCMGA